MLGDHAGGAVPLADLLRVAVGSVGPCIAAVAAVALTLAATNAYLTGAAALAARLRAERSSSGTARPVATTAAPPWRLQFGVAAACVLLLGAVALGAVTTAELVALPTTLFLTVYLGCTASATRILRGRVRFAAAAACAAVLSVLTFGGWAVILALAIVLTAYLPRWGRLARHRSNRVGARPAPAAAAASRTRRSVLAADDATGDIRRGRSAATPFSVRARSSDRLEKQHE